MNNSIKSFGKVKLYNIITGMTMKAIFSISNNIC